MSNSRVDRRYSRTLGACPVSSSKDLNLLLKGGPLRSFEEVCWPCRAEHLYELQTAIAAVLASVPVSRLLQSDCDF